MDIELSLGAEEFIRYYRDILENSFPDRQRHDIPKVARDALHRTAVCFASIILPGYTRNGTPQMSHLHGDQSAIFLYYLSNSAFQIGDRSLAEKCMLLNKARNAIQITYDTALPKHMLLIHTIGTMLGKAAYGDYFVATQNVTVGSHNGHAPTFGQGVVLYPGSFIAGASVLGDYTRVAAGATAIDVVSPSHSVVTGQYPATLVKPLKRLVESDYFRVTA